MGIITKHTVHYQFSLYQHISSRLASLAPDATAQLTNDDGSYFTSVQYRTQ